MSHAWRFLVLLTAVFLAAAPAPAVTFRIIVVSSKDDAQRVAERVRAGESFAELAKTLSIDPSAKDGGLIGPIDPSTLRPELREAVQGRHAGDVTPPITVPAGFAIVQIVEVTSGPREATPATSAATIANPGLTATGSVKYALNIGGFLEALAAVDGMPKVADWNQHPKVVCDTRTQAVRTAVESLEAALRPGATRSSMSPTQLMQVHYTLGQLYTYDGRMDAAIDQFEQAYTIVSTAGSGGDPLALQLDEALGVAWLHKAEMDNDVYRHPGDRCLLSPHGLLAPDGAARFARTEALTKAIEHFQRYLSHKPNELEVKWLLNISYMTIGGYPDHVPPAHRISPSAFTSSEDIGRFVDVAEEAGLYSYSMSGGVIVDDFDNDGRFDIVTSTYDWCAPMRFFHRQPDGGFVERGAAAGLADQIGGLNLMQTDYDNDGCLDILLLRGAWERPQRKSLLHNNCNGTFTDVTDASGLATPLTSTQAAVWTDIDNDGFLDLFVGNEGAPAQLFRNNHDGTFTDIAAAAGIDKTGYIKGVTALDYDNDGWPDLYLSNLSGDNFLYHNNHNRTFTEVGHALGVAGSGKGFVTWAFDYDNDGWEDLFATSYFTSVDETARTYLGLPHNATTLKLYKNLGNGSFRDVTREVGLDKVFMPMGANFGDVDNDGFLDIYLGTGNPSYVSTVGSVLLRNRAGKSFVDITASSGTGELHKGHGVAFADLDNDGNDDIVFVVGGAVPGDAHALRLFRNPGQGNDWLTLKLVGVKTNRAAIGARIAVTVEDASGRRTVHRTVSSGGSFGASPLAQHIGLGHVDRIVDVEIWWPTSNTRQRFTDVAKNQMLRIEELATTYAKVEQPRLPLGKSAEGQKAAGPERYTVTGMVLDVQQSRARFVVSHESVPGAMDAMTMTFDVRDPTELDGVTPGARVTFTLVVDSTTSYAEQVRVLRYESPEQDPLTARRLRLLNEIVAGRASGGTNAHAIAIGQTMPDFSLIDQARQPVTLSQYRGRVVAVNFIYTSCALPQFCFRIASQFGVLQRQFRRELARDLVLLTITFDPARDRPEVLAAYARDRLKAEPDGWHFLTGEPDDVRRVCEMFGVESFPDEGLMNHSSRTAIIDRRGTLVANIEGNEFTSKQLVDLVDTVLRR